MTHRTVNIRLPPKLQWHAAALAAEGIFGSTIEEVVVELTRNALHRDWHRRREINETPRPSETGSTPCTLYERRYQNNEWVPTHSKKTDSLA